MSFLVVSKSTNLELHGEKIRKRIALGLLESSHMVRLKQAHEEHYRTLESLLELLTKYNVPFMEVGRGHFWPEPESIHGIITVGGDGTLLQASHKVRDASVPVIGVCSSTLSVGHLCAVRFSELESLVHAVRNKVIKTIQIQRLYAEITSGETGSKVSSVPVLNDILFANFSPGVTTRYALKINSFEEEQKSSGIWIATAAGSTSVVATAGGIPVPMESGEAQYLVRELFVPPVSQRAKELELQKGFFAPDSNTFEIENHCEQALLALDGQHGTVQLNFGDKVRILRAKPLSLAV